MFSHLKSVVRRPFSMILLILLLCAVTFGFTARAVEYFVVTHAVDALSEYYKAIGYLSASDGDVTQGARLLAESDLVAVNDVQRYCAGTLNGIYNADLDGKSSSKGYHVSEVLLWGELTEKRRDIPEASALSKQESYKLQFRVVQRLYGYPDYAPEDGYLTVTYAPQADESDWTAAFDALQVGCVYGVRAYYSGSGTYTSNLLLRRAVPEGEWFLSQGDTQVEDFVEADTAQEINRHRVTLNGTKDMSALPFTQEVNRDGYLIDGRWLTAADNESANPVCVILQDFAEARGLCVGDTLTISLCDEQRSYGYYPEGTTLEDVSVSNVTTVFTIVGIFNRTIFSEGYSSASYRSLTIYVPDSCIPIGYHADVASLADGSVYESGYSFVLVEPDAESEFLQQYRGELERMGYTVTMIENGWAEFSASAEPIRQSTAYSAAMFTLVQLLALVLAGFLYLRQHRREFAIARALGIPAPRVIGWHLLPVAAAGILGIGIGSVFAWRYALEQAQATLSSLIREGQSVSTELSVWILTAIFVSSLALLVLITRLGYAALSHHSVMDILHEVHKNQRPQKAHKSIATAATMTAAPLVPKKTAKWDLPSTSASVGNGKSGFVRFTRRHACRSKGGTALILVVAIVFILALGWIQASMQQTSQSIDEMYGSLSVEAEILKRVSGSYTSEPGFIAGTTVDAIIATGFVQDSNLVAAATDAELSKASGNEDVVSYFTLCGVANAELLNQEEASGIMVAGGDGAITYQSGWDASMFRNDYGEPVEWYPIVISEALLETLDAHLGDHLMLGADVHAVTAVIVGSYAGQFNGLGTLSGDAVLMPLSLMQKLYGSNLYYSVAKFSLAPALNRELDTFRTAAEQIIKNDAKSLLSLNLVIWDEALRMVVQPMEKNLAFMQVLYPVAQTAAFFAAGIVALLLLLQEAKTAAILRVLGIPARTVRRMLGMEQLVLGLVGVAAGMLASAALGKWSVPLLLCAVIYLLGLAAGTAAGSMTITRKKPLELLQVKE